MYHSEHGQDKYLAENVFPGKRGGVFVEFGAIDGIITSNTLYFEKEMGWIGLCVEPIPEQFDKLRRNRGCFCENYAISDKLGKAKFVVVEDVVGWSGIYETIEPQHRNRITENGSSLREIQVVTIPIARLLRKYRFFEIDYMTIDTEGNEEKIIRSFPFDEFNVKVFDIENNFGNYDISAFMLKHKYRVVEQLGPNQIFVKERKGGEK